MASRAADAHLEELMREIQRTLDADPEHPWCIHRLYEELLSDAPRGERVLELTERAADSLAEAGRARREAISAMTIGVHCQDCLYWSVRSPNARLSDFGPDYESPRILRRLASHFECHGL
jgi:hypothetical protein